MHFGRVFAKHVLNYGICKCLAVGKGVKAIQTRSGVEVYRQADAARTLKVSRGRIAQMIAEGKLSYVDQDGFRLVTAESLRLAQREMNPLLIVGKSLR